MQEAAAANDREAVTKSRDEYRETFAPMHDIMKKADDDLANVLTDEQKTKQKEYRITTAIKAMAAPVELTDDQIKKLVADAQGHEGERGSVDQKVSEALDQMLTADQKQPLQDIRRWRKSCENTALAASSAAIRRRKSRVFVKNCRKIPP